MGEVASSGQVMRSATPWVRHICHLAPLLLLSGAGFVLALPAPPFLGAWQFVYAAVVALNVWQLAISSWSAVLGVGVGLWQRTGGSVGGPLLRPPTGRARTAVLLPVYEEDAVRVFAAATVIADSIAGIGAGLGAGLGAVDIYVLSDTRSIAGGAAEERIAARLAAQTAVAQPAASQRAEHAAARPRILYRRRPDNTGRKAGNIAEWFGRWGGAYDYAVVLDADSLMTGAAIARLVGAMEANPRAGLIQAMCYPVGRRTLFARIQQFSARLYGPVFQRGVSFWQGPRGNYWGHNAILRTHAFAAHCGLPTLPGPPPFGGEIMSHDTVEAALLLRGGWDVWMIPDGPDGRHEGSWEETPTNLIDHLARDRRWCMGNLQHVAVLRARGLQVASVYHLTRGLLHYLYIVPFLLWVALYAAVDLHTTPGAGAALVVLVLALVALPRAICLHAALGEDVPGFGGRAGLVASTVLDQGVAYLLYPVAVVFHTLFIVNALTGRVVRWDAQLRDDRDLGWAAAAAILAGPCAAGLAVLALLGWCGAPVLAAALAPGLLLAVPVAVWTSRRSLGARASRHGIFATPDETRPPAAWTALKAAEAALAAATLEHPIPPLPPEQGLPLTVQVLRPKRMRATMEAAAPPVS